MMNIKFLLIGMSLSLFPNQLCAQYAETDCPRLGYISPERCGNGLKCPFGEYWNCPKVIIKAIPGQCNGYAENCKIGDILNSDGTCSGAKEKDKIPLGVVIVIKDKCGWAMTASPIQRGIKKQDASDDMTALPDYSLWRAAINDYDACGNTKKIIQSRDRLLYPVIWRIMTYAPAEAIETRGKWCLPSAGMLKSLYVNLDAINKGISKIGGTELVNDNEHIWSSTRTLPGWVWYFCTENDSRQHLRHNGVKYGSCKDDIYNRAVVRSVIAF